MDNMGQTVLSVSEFARNIVKLNIDRSICHFDKEWPKCPWVNFFKNTSSSEKKLLMETYVEYLKGNMVNWLTRFKHSLDQSLLRTLQKPTMIELYVNLIKSDQCFLNGWYRSNHSVCDSNFLKTFETEKKAWAFNKNLIESLKRKITVKPCCAWHNFSMNF